MTWIWEILVSLFGGMTADQVQVNTHTHTHKQVGEEAV